MKQIAIFTLAVASLGALVTTSAAEHSAKASGLMEMANMAPAPQEMLDRVDKKKSTEIVEVDDENTLDDDIIERNVAGQKDTAGLRVKDENNKKEIKEARNDGITMKKDYAESFENFDDFYGNENAELDAFEPDVETKLAVRSPYRDGHGDGDRGDHGDGGEFGRPGAPGHIRPPGYVGRIISCRDWLSWYPGYHHCHWPTYRRYCRFDGPFIGRIPRCSEIYCCRQFR